MRRPAVKRLGALLLALASAPLLLAEGQEVSEARLSARDGGKVLVAELPGPVVSALVAGQAEGKGGVFLLVRPDGEVDGERSLYFLDPRGDGKLTLLRGGLPGGAKALEVLALEAGGEPELVLGTLGQLFSLGPLNAIAAEGPLAKRIDHPGFDLRSLSPSPLRVAGMGREIAVAEPGFLRLYRPDGEGGVSVAARLALPLSARREPMGLAVTSPPVHRLAGIAGGPDVYASGPVRHGDRRVSSVLLDVGTGERLEAWGRLPGAEKVEQSWYLRIDGRPCLVVTSQTADELNLLEKKRLRVFPLAADRTRAGKLPLAQLVTSITRWFDMSAEVADLDGDGKQDLLVAGPDGLQGDDLSVWAYPGLGGGRFGVQARKTQIQDAPQRWKLVGDLSEDGAADLVAVREGALEVWPTSPKGKPLARQPSFRLELPAVARAERSVSVGAGEEGTETRRDQRGGWDDLTAVDLDADGRLEILVLATDLGGRGRLVIARPGR